MWQAVKKGESLSHLWLGLLRPSEGIWTSAHLCESNNQSFRMKYNPSYVSQNLEFQIVNDLLADCFSTITLYRVSQK